MSRHLHLVTAADQQRFWSAVTKTPTCWLWMGEVNNHGYGRFAVWRENARMRILTHRLSYWITHGDLPRLLRHSCDTPCCVNPAHLIPGTQAQNIRDAVERGRADLSGLAAYRAQRDERVQQRIRDGLKWCPQCRQTKPLDAFGVDRARVDGRLNWCRTCQASRRAERRTV